MIRTSAIIASGLFPCGTAVLQGSTEECFRQAAACGYDGVQLTVRVPEDYEAAECCELMKKYGLSITAMATGRIYTVDGLSMGSSQEDNRLTCVERLKAFADYAVKIGRPGIVIGAVRGLYRDADSPEEYYRQFDRSLRELTAYCEPLNVPVLLEANDHLEADAYLDPAETLAYVREIGSPVLHMYLDVMHLYNEGLDAADAIRRFGRDVCQIDISGEDRAAPALSKLDFPGIARAIRESGFSGTLTFEIPPAPPENSARESLKYIRKLLEE